MNKKVWFVSDKLLLKKTILILLLDIIVATAVFLVAYFWTSLAQIIKPCPIYEYLGIYCIGCGGTRFFYHLINFRFSTAFQNNPYLFFICLYFVFALISLNLSVFFNKPIYRKIMNKKWLWFWIVAGLLFFILRNIFKI